MDKKNPNPTQIYFATSHFSVHWYNEYHSHEDDKVNLLTEIRIYPFLVFFSASITAYISPRKITWPPRRATFSLTPTRLTAASWIFEHFWDEVTQLCLAKTQHRHCYSAVLILVIHKASYRNKWQSHSFQPGTYYIKASKTEWVQPVCIHHHTKPKRNTKITQWGNQYYKKKEKVYAYSQKCNFKTVQTAYRVEQYVYLLGKGNRVIQTGRMLKGGEGSRGEREGGADSWNSNAAKCTGRLSTHTITSTVPLNHYQLHPPKGSCRCKQRSKWWWTATPVQLDCFVFSSCIHCRPNRGHKHHQWEGVGGGWGGERGGERGGGGGENLFWAKERNLK